MNVNDLFKASFGQFGSVYLTGDGALLDLDGATANRFVIAIQFMEDTTFQKIQTLDGLVSSITSDVAEDDAGDAFGALTNESTNTDMDTLEPTHTFPKGITIYGKWDHIELNSGSCICYLAPVGY
tara:strand:- start:2550 stop:2924 length:375 start_codon:yes stop_codon:yes gene_type:complete